MSSGTRAARSAFGLRWRAPRSYRFPLTQAKKLAVASDSSGRRRANLMQVIALFTQYRVNKRYSGPGWWMLGSAAWTLGFTFNYLRSSPGLGQISILANNLLFVSGLALLYVVVLRSFEQREQRTWLIAFCVVVTPTATFFTYADNNLAARRVKISVALAVLSFLIAQGLYEHKTHSIAMTANFLTGLFLINSLFFAARGLTPFTGGPIGDLFTSSLTQTATYLIALITSTLWTLGFIVMINQRLTEEIRESSSNLELIFNTNPDAVMVTRLHDGYILTVNDGFTTMSGFTRAEVIGKSSLEVEMWQNPEDRQRLVSNLSETGVCMNLEINFRRKDGSLFIGILSAKCISLQGNPHIISVIHDINDRKQAEISRQKLEAQTRQIAKAESLNRMAGAIAHHFNNKLQGVIGNLDLAMGHPESQNGLSKNLSQAMNAAQTATELSRLMLV
jgi:PAS domain S-box-containing protein